MHINKSFRVIAPLIATIGLISTGIWYYSSSKATMPLADFVYKRDMPEILDIINENWYWLFPEPKESYHPGYVDYVFKHKAPQANPMHHDKLIIKILHIDNKVAGFVAYYMKTKHIGMLLFLAVKHEYRGKQYGEKMARYAIEQLIKMGANQINLVTRTDNTPAQRIYTKIGFHEIMRDEHGLVYFVYEPHNN
ncbi:MAG TPA: GNAT family N-acetyltransferase [Candidatus Babeliales bacterium]|jgi:ribosomal protein S18 acetylase RimI-like enzyme|nr:GNAT family N-acetyltransferase [Candidatus Babeliales bacterium]